VPVCIWISNEHSSAGQSYRDFRELARLRIDVDCTCVLFDDDVVTDGFMSPSGRFTMLDPT